MSRSTAIVVCLILAGASYWLVPGLVHPDEIFQALEPANRAAFGFGVKAWEWDVGLRNWAVPGLLAGLLRLCAALDLDDVWARRGVLSIPSLALHAAALLAVFRFAARRLDATLATWCVALVGTAPVVLLFANRTLSESFSGALLLIAFERLDAAEVEGRRVAFVSGVLFGLAEVTRYGTAPFILVVLVWLAARRSALLLPLVAGGGVIALALGVLDASTWGVTVESPRLGGFWHSLVEYTDFNIIKGKAGGFGRSPWWAYFPVLGVVWVALSLVVWRWNERLRASLPLLASLVYLVSIMAVPHKEDRFVYPAALLLLMISAPAFVWLASRLSARLPGPAVIAATLLSVPLVPDGLLPKGSELITLTARAQREGSGLLIVHAGLWGTGGSFFAGGSNLMRLGDDVRPTVTRRWCTADDADDPGFVRAVADDSVRRAIVLNPTDVTTLSLTSAGFRQTDSLGDAAWFER
ncbi:MAG: mannosyltransferase [Myxococcales bacterium]|nr:mannosyltransferase [Myxococcales bacterium]